MLIFGNAERIFTVFGGCVMNDIDELWDIFAVSGSVEDYLKYRYNDRQVNIGRESLFKAEKTKEEQVI